MTPYVLLSLTAAGAIALSVTRPRSSTGLSWFLGAGLLFVGQRTLYGDTSGSFASFLGLAVLGATLLLRLISLRRATEADGVLVRAGLKWQTLATLGIMVYGMSSATVGAMLGLSPEGIERWTVTFSAVWPILVMMGAFPMLWIDWILARHPVAPPASAADAAVPMGWSLAFAIALAFPVNYLADVHNVRWDTSHFQVSQPGSATAAVLRNLDEAPEVLLFYPPASEVKEDLLLYFDQLFNLRHCFIADGDNVGARLHCHT